MKNLKNALGMVSVFAILIFVFVSCDKGSSPTPQPDPPPTSTKLQISATAPTSKVWFGDPASGTVSTNLPATIIANPGTVTGGSYIVPSVTGQISVKLSASSNGQTAETTVVVDCYTQKQTFLMNSGLWNVYRSEVNGVVMPPSSYCFSYSFAVDGKVTITPCGSASLPPGPFTLSPGEDTLTFGGVSYSLVSISSTEMVLTTVNFSGQLVRLTLKH